jgi:hypothetical protein
MEKAMAEVEKAMKEVERLYKAAWVNSETTYPNTWIIGAKNRGSENTTTEGKPGS